MTEQHPITPPPELVEQWIQQYGNSEDPRWQTYEQDIATLAARWGSDQELMACINWLHENEWPPIVNKLRAARRPKPPSLAEQALEALETEDDALPLMSLKRSDRFDLIRRALERLQELEGANG